MEVIVRGKSEKKFSDLLAAGQFYVKEHCRQWLERRATCVLPPIPWTVYNRALGPDLKKDGKRIGKERGDDAELMVCKNLIECGKQKEEPMFILAQLVYDPDNKSKQMRAILEKFLSDPGQLEQLIKNKMDVDLIIMHQEIGAIIMEVKAAIDPPAKIGALQKAESLLRVFCGETFPIYKVAVFPNCESLSEKEIKRLEGKNGFKFCDKNFATNPDAVSKLLSCFKKMTLDKGYLTLKKGSDELLYWLISLKCIVSSTVHDRKVMKTILRDDAISVTKQVKKTNDKLVQHDVFSPSDLKSEHARKLQVTKQVLYLTPEQIAVWDGPERQIIHGVAGTGKTVLIQHKVLQLAKNLPCDEKIIVIATNAISKVYHDFFKQNGVGDRVEVYGLQCSDLGFGLSLFTDLPFNLPFDLKDKVASTHVFIDEAQRMMERVRTIGKNRSSAKYLWIALDPVQADHEVDIQHLAKELEISSVSQLTSVMRCTPEVLSCWAKYVPSGYDFNQGNRLFVQDVRKHPADSDSKVVECIISLLDQCVDGENVTYKDCAVICHQSLHQSSLEKRIFRENFFFKNHMSVIHALGDDVWSLEWIYVFLVTPDTTLRNSDKLTLEDKRLLYLAISRCKVQLFLITVTHSTI